MNCDEIIETISGHEQTIIFRFYSFLTAVNNIAQPLDSTRASKIKYVSFRNDKKNVLKTDNIRHGGRKVGKFHRCEATWRVSWQTRAQKNMHMHTHTHKAHTH